MSEIVIRSGILKNHVFNDSRPTPDSSVTGSFPALVFETIGSRDIPKGDQTWYETTLQATLLGLIDCQTRQELVNLERGIRKGLTKFSGCVNGMVVHTVRANLPIPDPDLESGYYRFTTDYRIVHYERMN